LGISGLSSSGKTTLSRHLRALLEPCAFIVHQDDFFLADRLVPRRAGGLQDWDCAEAINWARLTAALDRVRTSGALPADLKSHQDTSPVDAAGAEQSRVADDTVLRLQRKLRAAAAAAAEGVAAASVAIVDGFLMLHEHSPIESTMDAKILLRVPRDTVRRSTPPPPPFFFRPRR
jgi:nicotinamide/nicotinate riboside kinase